MHAAFQRPYQILKLQTTCKKFVPSYGYFRTMYDNKRSLLCNSCFVASNDLNDNIKLLFLTPLKSYHNHINLFHTSTSNNFRKKLAALQLFGKDSGFSSIKIFEIRKAPMPVLGLGFTGLLPFGFPPIQSILFSYSPFLANCQLVYGAAILSFLGGVKWGHLLSRPREDMTWKNYGLSVLPSLVAAVALIIPQFFGFIVIIAGLLGAFLVDLKSSNYPPWFISLRAILTGISVLCLLISLLQTLFH